LKNGKKKNTCTKRRNGRVRADRVLTFACLFVFDQVESVEWRKEKTTVTTATTTRRHAGERKPWSLI
jgi:hypothetical protein